MDIKRRKDLPEYSVWKDMKKRCYNPNNKRYKQYSEKGITVCSEWINNFPQFYADMGPRPKDGRRWSIGRIDNLQGYSKENCRWELDSEQARNHSRQSNNTTGMTGIQIRLREITGRVYTSVTACWAENGKKKTKDFSADKFGMEQAIQLALAYRQAQLDRLANLGVIYAESHGKK